MIITLRDKPVGTLHPDSSIESSSPELQGLDEYWKKNGIVSYGGPIPEKVSGAIVDGAIVRMPSAETLGMVVWELQDRGYKVVGYNRTDNVA